MATDRLLTSVKHLVQAQDDLSQWRDHLPAQLLIPHLDEPTLQAAVQSGFADGFFTVITGSGEMGQQVARNRLYDRAHAPYLAYLDADDRRLPGALSSQLQVMEAESADVVFSSNQYGVIYQDVLLSLIHSRVNASCLWRRSALDQIADQFGQPWDESYQLCSDAVILLRALQADLKVRYCDVPCIWAAPNGKLTQDKELWAQDKLRLLDEIESFAPHFYLNAIVQERGVCRNLISLTRRELGKL